MLIDAVRELIGAAPPGYEHYEYIAVGVFGLLIVYSCLLLVGGIFKVIGGRR